MAGLMNVNGKTPKLLLALGSSLGIQHLARVATGVFFLFAPAAFASTNLSTWVFPGSSGRLLSSADALGNRIMDTSSAGYKSGLVPLPLANSVPVRTNLSPVAGDNLVRIQNAINYVQSLPLDTNGFRGAVLLNAGEYALSNSITISASGVVLRGAGSGTNGTVLRATAANQYTLVKITGSGSAATVSGTTHTITNRYVPVGARSFQVDSTSGLAAGDHLYVRRVATTEWIQDLGMDLLGPSPVYPWSPGSYMIDMDRVIKRIEGNRIFIDAPVTCAIDAGYTNGTIRKFTWSGRIANSGIEHLRGVSDYDAGVTDDENHGWIFVECNSLENGWVRDVVSEHFGNSCVSLDGGCKFVTVADSQCLDPISQITGGRRYAFVMDGAVLCLVANCYTRLDRHQFVTGSRVDGPNVFVDGLSDSAQSDAGPHHRWATGILWDNITINGQNLNIQNRGNLGTGHGWAGANCVAYNCDADGGYVVQNPPGAHNWLIGSIGTIENGTVYVGPHDPGTYDSHGTNVFPNSLYYAQLQDRLAAPNLVTREYWLGEIDSFTNVPEVVPVDAAWSNAVQAVAGGKPLDGFNVVATNHWVPFTFNYSLASTDRVIAASLTLSMRSASGATNLTIYLDSTTNAFSFASLGWLPIAGGTNTTVRVLDLTGQTNLLADGKLNIAVADGVGIDWALLQLEVAPVIIGGDVTNLAPVADATVNGGVSANLNFGTATTLTVKDDTSNDYDRKAFLRWDLSSVTGTVYSAKIRLTPVSVGTNGIETGVAVSTNNAWTEAGITWNNQPGVGKRFATWIPGTNAPVEFMVTPQVLDALNGDKQLSIQLYSLRNVGGAGIVTFASREAANASTRPQLILLTAVSSPVRTWSGATSGNMSGTPANWGGTVPTATDIAQWNTATYNNAPSANVDMSIGQLLFDAGNTGGVTFGAGASTLTLTGNSGTGIQMNSGSGAVNTASIRFALGDAQKWSNGDNSPLTVGGTIDTGGFLLTLDGVGATSLNGIISGSGGLSVANGTVTLNGANTFTGGIVVSNGTLGGNGVIAGLVSIETGATLSPGASIGRLTINNALSLASGSVTFIELNKALGTNDAVVCSNVVFGGALVVTNLGGSLVVGDAFQIFQATNFTGNFASIVGSPGPLKEWSFNPATGVLSVVGTLPSDFQMNITFPGYNRAEVLTNIPLLVVLGSNIPGFSYTQFYAPNAGDLRFTTTNGLTELNYELDTWNPAGDSRVWVQVPLLTSNTAILASWGNRVATNPPGSSTSGAAWSGSYVGVWHLNNPSATDSTAGGHHVSVNTAVTTNGLIGSAAYFNGSSAMLQVPWSSDFDLAGNFEVQGWFKVAAADKPAANNYLTLTSKEATGSFTDRNWWIALRSDGKLWWKSSPGIDVTNNTDIANGAWHHFAAVHDGAAARLYLDGLPAAIDSTPGTASTQNAPVFIGAEDGNARYHKGPLDELRISNVPRSSNWVWAVYQNIASNGAFNAAAPVTSLAWSSPTLNAVFVSGQLQLNWPSTHLGWILQTQTNSRAIGLTLPTNTWFDVAGSASLTNTSNSINPADPTVFFRLREP